MADQEFVLKLYDVDPADREALLQELRALDSIKVIPPTPALSGASPIEVITVVCTVISTAATVVPLVSQWYSARKAKEKKGRVKVFLPNEEVVDFGDRDS